MSFPIKDNDSALESIEHELYNPKIKIEAGDIHRVKAHKSDITLPTSWGDESPILTKGKEDTSLSFGVKLLLLSVILLLGALSFSAWRVFSMRNVVSSTNIDMTADISPFLEGGESSPLVLTLRNRNTSPLEEASVTLLYKQGNSSQDEQEKVQEKRDLGSIKTGEYKKQNFSVLLYGAEGETRDLVVKLEYKVAGSNALFSKFVDAKVVLKTPPISVSIDGPEKLSVGQSGTYVFTIKNNSATTSLPSVLTLTLPNSFTIERESPQPVSRTTSWRVDRLKPGESTTVTIKGSYDGKQGETGTMQAKIGSVGENASTIGIVYASQVIDTTLRSSPLTLTTSILGTSGAGDAIKYGDTVALSIVYSNTSTEALEDVIIVLHLSGEAPIYSMVDPTSGYYDSVQKTITWSKASVPDLMVLAPNSHGTLRVVIPIIQKGNNSPTLVATVTGTVGESSQDATVTTVSKTWGVQGSASLQVRTQYSNSPFSNIGPVPPQANEETTYTAHLSVSAQNSLSSARVSFTLPAYVSWRGVVSDESAVTYDSKTRTITWDIGALEQGKSSSVDVGLVVKPSQSHVGQTPSITSGIILDADEEVSRAHLHTVLSPLTTYISGERWQENPAVVVGGR